MKESKIYWSVKKDLMSQLLLKNKTPLEPPSFEDLLKILKSSTNEEKLKGIINNCLQKSTRRVPI